MTKQKYVFGIIENLELRTVGVQISEFRSAVDSLTGALLKTQSL